MTAFDAVAAASGAVGFGFALVRWLRVAQREHYLVGGPTRFARRSTRSINTRRYQL